MNQLENKNLKELLDEFLEVHYSGSFARMVSEYIRATGMTETEGIVVGGGKERIR